MMGLKEHYSNWLVRYFCPDFIVESIWDINLELLKEKGYKALILDLDNTLLGWRSQNFPPKVQEWLKKAETLAFKRQIVSNSFPRRVRRLSAILGIPFISQGIKPRKKAFAAALKALEAKPEETVVVGDQLFTDVLGGKRMNLFTILVSPIDKNEFFTTRILRIPEKMLLNYFKKCGFF